MDQQLGQGRRGSRRSLRLRFWASWQGISPTKLRTLVTTSEGKVTIKISPAMSLSYRTIQSLGGRDRRNGRRRTRPGQLSTLYISTQESSAIQELLNSAQLLATRQTPIERSDADIRQFIEFMNTRLKKVSPMHHGVLVSKFAHRINLMEEPVMARGAIEDPTRLLDSVPMPAEVAGPSHLWQPPAPHTSAPPPPPVYHQPQYQQT